MMYFETQITYARQTCLSANLTNSLKGGRQDLKSAEISRTPFNRHSTASAAAIILSSFYLLAVFPYVLSLSTHHGTLMSKKQVIAFIWFSCRIIRLLLLAALVGFVISLIFIQLQPLQISLNGSSFTSQDNRTKLLKSTQSTKHDVSSAIRTTSIPHLATETELTHGTLLSISINESSFVICLKSLLFFLCNAVVFYIR